MASTDLEVGTVLDGTYELTGKLGSGGMGTVWQARHLRLPKAVAVKVLREAIDTGSDLYARFRREAEIASELGHPHIVEALDFNTLPDGSPYLVLELLRGQSLRDRIQRGGAMGLDLVVHVTRQMTSALHAAHAHGVVHRDLKPENIFLCEVEGELLPHVKVLDFGISKLQTAQTALTQEGMIFGTPYYMAPEQARGVDAEPAADQFALACIVYEMLTGELAFSGTPVQVLYQVVHEEPRPLAELLPGLPAKVAATVERALSKQPTVRFPDVTAFAASLVRAAGLQVTTPSPSIAPAASLPTLPQRQATLQGPASAPHDLAYGETMASPSPAPVAPTRASPRRRGLLVGGLAVAALALGGAGVYLLTTGSDDARSDPGHTAEARPSPVAAVTPDGAPPDAAPRDTTPPDAALAGRAPDRSAPRAHASPRSARPKQPALSPEQRAQIVEARRLLEAGKPRGAAVIAERLIRNLPPTKRWPAHEILARVACMQVRLPAARAHLANVPRHRRRAIKKFCSKYLDFVD